MQTQVYLTTEDLYAIWWHYYLKYAFVFACLVLIPIVFGALCDVVMNELHIFLMNAKKSQHAAQRSKAVVQ